MQDMIIRGTKISINGDHDVVRILDTGEGMNEEAASYIIWYLYEEGFLEKNDITCEIIRETS